MRISSWTGSFLFSAALLAQGPQLAPLSDAVDRMGANLRLQGVALEVMRDREQLHRSEHGNLGCRSAIPIGSASKWLTVAMIMTLVEAGVLDLDAPVARYVEEFDRSEKRVVTLRQCLSCTAGFAARPGRMRRWDSERFAAETAKAPLRAGPGERFLSSGIGLQVAAIAAERVTGKNFHELFAERIAEPLGLQDTQFGSYHPLAGDPGVTPLPWAAGGAVSTLDDYSSFMAMLLARGCVGDRQVLSADSIDAMFSDQVLGQAEVRAERFEGHVRYGLGTWIVELHNGAHRVAELGSFGFMPWIDLDLGIGCVLAVRDRGRRIIDHLPGIQAEVRRVALSPLVVGSNSTVTFGFDGRERRYHLHVPAKAPDNARMPLVVVLHAEGGSGEQIAETTRFAAVADREVFVVAFPDGTGRLRHRHLNWNSGGMPSYAAEHDVDDTGFLREVVADIARQLPIDPARIYVAGHGNGGMMCHRLAREAGDLFAGIAVVGGAMNFSHAGSVDPIGVLMIHGTADEHVLYHGGAPRAAAVGAGDRIDVPMQEAIDYYVRRDGLHGYPDSKTAPHHADVRIDTYGKSLAGKAVWGPVRVITLQGGGHAWPGPAARPRLFADRPFDYDATEAIGRFFAMVRKAPERNPPAVPR